MMKEQEEEPNHHEVCRGRWTQPRQLAKRKRLAQRGELAPEFGPACELDTELAAGALQALDRGDLAGHDRLIADAAARLAARGAEVIALAQFSMARSSLAVELRCGLPVLSTVDSAVRRLRSRLS